jgi:membrane protein YfhO
MRPYRPRREASRARESVLALLAAMCLFAFALRASLFDPSVVLFGVDTASVQLPWSAVTETGGRGTDAASGSAAQGARAPRNPGLADQGMVFYPAYRFVSESWLAGDPPLWNPKLYLGAPCAGNPQFGAFDPQVGVLVGLERSFGRQGFDWGLAGLAWLRLSFAAAGAFVLARVLGLSRFGAALAGLSFGLSGFLALWVNFSLGHVACFLPWVLVGIEGMHGDRRRRASSLTAIVFALAILGGHPETAFYVGAAALVWSFAQWRQRRGVTALALCSLGAGALLAGVCLLPFGEYLANSGALLARRALPEPGEPDWIALGVLVLVAGILLRWQALVRIDEERAERPARSASRARIVGIAGAALAVTIAALALAVRGMPDGARLFLWPDLFGAPGKTPGGYVGPGSYLEEASAWVPLVTLVLALAALLDGPARASILVGKLRRRGVILGLGAASLLLALRAPGVLDLYRFVPLAGLAATVRLSVVSSLMLSLLAGEGLERASRTARVASVSAIACLLAFCLYHGRLEPLAPELAVPDRSEGLVTFTRTPADASESETGPERAALEGWVHPGLPVATIRARAESLSERGEVLADAGFELPVELARAPWSASRPSADPALPVPTGATFFRTPYLWLEHLAEGHWRFSIDLYGSDGHLLGTRVAGVRSLQRSPHPTTLSLALTGFSLLALALLPPLTGWTALLMLALAALQGLWFFVGTNPAVPRAECFPPTRTVEILQRELGTRRYLSSAGVLPPDTGLVHGLRSLDGYDGLDVASFDGYRVHALKEGVQPLLGFNARGVDLDSPAFKLLGVGCLVLDAPLEHPDWELLASPGGDASGKAGGDGVEQAECWIYRARSPLPQAFCVGSIRSKDEVLADLEHFDPLREAFVESGNPWIPSRPCTASKVEIVSSSNNRVSLRAELDGEGLLVLAEQAFPGWRARVDGVEYPVLRVDSVLRGVALTSGKHQIEFRYAPESVLLGLVATLLGSILCILLLIWGRLIGEP